MESFCGKLHRKFKFEFKKLFLPLRSHYLTIFRQVTQCYWHYFMHKWHADRFLMTEHKIFIGNGTF